MKQPKLKIGQQYRVIKDEYNYGLKTPRIVRVESLGVEESFFDEKDYFYDTLSSQFELQLIKQKTKKVKKYLYSREEILKKYTGVNEITNEFLRDLLSIKSQPIKKFKWSEIPKLDVNNEYKPIKEESNKECHCGKNGHALNSINCPVHGYTVILNKQTIKQQSKDIEFEEIGEIKKHDGAYFWTQDVPEVINQLIRNQNKLISLNKRNIK